MEGLAQAASWTADYVYLALSAAVTIRNKLWLRMVLSEVDYLCFVELNVNVLANVLMFWAVWTMRQPVASSAADISTTVFIVIPSCSPVTHSVAH